MAEEDFLDWPRGKPIRLDNVTCIYCGAPLDKSSRTKEHVVGRRFVPKGSLDGQWNLICWACRPCNGIKADLEDDLSAITMYRDAGNVAADDDKMLLSENLRKAQGSKSRRTGKSVNQSQEHIEVKIPFSPNVEFTFTLIAPPQVERDRLVKLARMHITAFFYWITFDQATKSGRFWRGGFFLVMEAARGDWGNPVLRAFTDAVSEWDPRVLGIGGKEFFKIAIKRHPSALCWSWALEWNDNYRIVGFFGDALAAQAVFDSFPRLEATTLVQQSKDYVRYRIETPLAKSDDQLFSWPVSSS